MAADQQGDGSNATPPSRGCAPLSAYSMPTVASIVFLVHLSFFCVFTDATERAGTSPWVEQHHLCVEKDVRDVFSGTSEDGGKKLEAGKGECSQQTHASLQAQPLSGYCWVLLGIAG